MKGKKSIVGFLNSERAIFLLMGLAFIARMAMFFYLGRGALNNSDDIAYVQSGIVFANTGVISVWSTQPTAMIMPGMTVLAGLMCKIFGEGTAYIDSIRILWIILGTVLPYVVYRCCRFFLPGAYSLFAAAGFLLPNWAWSDNTFLTEPPFIFFFVLCIYFVLRMGEENGEKDKKALAGFVLSFMAALMFRANILIFLPFAAAYLLFVKKRKLRQLLVPAASLLLAMVVFVIPWSIRNYRLFNEFIPITAGTANPALKGTYQGESAPADDSLDYETHVYAPIREMYAEHFNPDGSFAPGADREKVNKETDRLMTRYRLQEWFRRDPLGLLWDYLVSKPACMLNWVWIWLPAPRLYRALNILSMVNLAMCAVAVFLSLIMKKKRGITLWLGFSYAANIYIIALSFASERYAAVYMPLRYMLAAIGLFLTVELIKELKAKRNTKKAAAA